MTRRTRAIVRANPLAQIAVGMFALASSFWIRSLPIALIALGCYAVAVALAVPAWRYPFACLLFSAIAAATIVYSTWRLGGHDERAAVTAGLRIMVLSWPGSVAVGYVDPARLADFLAQTLHLPARTVAAFSASLQRFASFGHAWTQIERVRRVRGVGPALSPASWFVHAASMSFAMLVHAMRGASQTAIAMDARGFATARDRTWAEPATWTRLDVAVVIIAALLGMVAPMVAVASR